MYTEIKPTWGRAHSPTQMHPGNHPNDRQEAPELLTIEVKLNGRIIAQATAINRSDLAEYSDYDIEAREREAVKLGVRELSERWRIEAHKRDQSCWALVERIASAMRLFQGENR